MSPPVGGSAVKRVLQTAYRLVRIRKLDLMSGIGGQGQNGLAALVLLAHGVRLSPRRPLLKYPKIAGSQASYLQANGIGSAGGRLIFSRSSSAINSGKGAGSNWR
jgi:hypothetical protein